MEENIPKSRTKNRRSYINGEAEKNEKRNIISAKELRKQTWVGTIWSRNRNEQSP